MPRDLRALSTTTGSPSFDRRGLLRLLHLLWPQNEPGFRLRLTITIALLAAAALLNALVPLLFAAAIDHLSVNRAALAAPLAILAGYVLLQWLARVLNESPGRSTVRSISACSVGWPCARSSTCTACRCAFTSAAAPARSAASSTTA